MAGKISDLLVYIGAKTDDFKKGVKDVTQEGEKLGYSFKKVGAAIAGAVAASAVIAFGSECVQLAKVAEGVEAAFKRIGDESMLEGLRKATKGTVNDLDLMKAAVQANNFGIPLQQMGSLLAFAHQRAKDTGQSVDYLVNSIVVGIGRKCLIGSTLVKTKNGLKRLDNLKPNEVVFTLSLSGEVIEGVINSVHNNGIRDVYKVRLVNGYEITGTENHRLYTDKGYKMIMELTPKSLLLTDSGFIQVKNIDYAGISEVYDITLPETENFYANGIVSHNSPLILDNLGISAVQLKEKMKGVGAETATVGDVAKAVGEIASESMSKISESAETSAEKTAKTAAAWTNVKTELGKYINSVINELTPVMTTFFSKFTSWLKGIDKLSTEEADGQINKLKNSIIELGKSTDLSFDQKKAEAIKITGERMSFLQKMARQYSDELEKLNSVNFLIRDRKSINLYKELLAGVNKELNTLSGIRGAEIDKLLNQGISEAAPPPIIDDTKEALGLLEAAKKKVEDLEKAIQKAPSQTIAGKLTADLLSAQKELENLQKKIKVEAFGTPAASGLKPMAPIQATGVSGTDWKADQMSGMQEWANSYTAATEQVVEANDAATTSMAGFATSFAEGLGGVIAGTESLGGAFVNAMSGFMSQLGQQMIAVGFAKTVLDKMLLTPGGGVAAIAIGTTLVALAGAARATMASGVKGGGGGSRSASSGSYSGTGQKEMTVQIEGITKGSDIYWSQKNYNTRLDSTISR